MCVYVCKASVAKNLVRLLKRKSSERERKREREKEREREL